MFDGTNTSRNTIANWIHDVRTYLTLTNTPPAQQALYASTYLADTAKTWYVSSFPTPPATLDTLLNEFKLHFSSGTEQDDVILALEGLRQGRRPIVEYTTDFKALSNQLSVQMSSNWLRLCFLKGMDPELAKLLVIEIDEKDSVSLMCQKALKKAKILEFTTSLPLATSRSLPSSGLFRPQTGPTSLPSSARTLPALSSRATPARITPTVSTSRSSSNPAQQRKYPGKLTQEERDILSANKGCFACRRVNAGHYYMDCPEYSGERRTSVKKEVVSIVDGYVVRRPAPDPSDNVSLDNDEMEPFDPYPSVPMITVPAKIQSAVVEAGVDCGASLNLISPDAVDKCEASKEPANPIMLHQALDPEGQVTCEKVVSDVVLPHSDKWKSSRKHEFTVAPLANHDVLLGMPFLASEGILIDPAGRELILPQCAPLSESLASSSIAMDILCQPPKGHVRVGNAYMLLPAEDAASLQADLSPVLDEDELRRLHQETMESYPDVFANKLPETLPHKDGPRHRITLKDEKRRIKGRMMRIPNKFLSPFKKWIDNHVKAGRLVPSSSHISSGTFLRPKKDPNAFPRVVHDYRLLNDNTVKDHTPLPRQDRIIEVAVQAKVRGKIDMVSAYYQHWVHAKDRHKTAILTPWGLYEWTVMPQGLCNAVASWQRFMNWVLRDYIGVFCEVYLDDILIYSNSLEEHKRHVCLILDKLREHGLIASEAKSRLFANRIEFLGHYISSKGVEPHPDKLDKISEFPTPQSTEDIKSFLGLVNYLATFDFLPGLADHSSVLTSLTRKGAQFEWQHEHQMAFDTIKRLTRSVQCLQRLDYESGEPVWLVSDASNRGIGGYVAQGNNWKTARPIGFYSRQYRSAEKNYPTHDQEMLAVVECMKHWYPQLMGARFEVLTDHAPLQHWKTQRMLSRRQLRWLDFLAEFDFDIRHIPGITNTAADALSRYPFAQVNTVFTVELDAEILNQIQDGYKDDTFFGPVYENPQQYPMYELTPEGLLFTKEGRLCIPSCKMVREVFLRQHHDNENHFGRAKTRATLARLYFWPNMATDVKAYVSSCSQCQRNKSSTQVPAGYLHPLPTPIDRFHDISMDFVGPVPKSKGYDMLFVVTDRLTGYVKVEPTLQTATAKDIAELFHRTWFRQFGLPHSIVSDRDKLFLSHFWKELHRLLDIKLKMSTAYHPETDGSTERSNKTIIESIRQYINHRHTDWAVHLTHVESVFNNSVNVSTGFAPNELTYGTTVRLFPSLKTPIDSPVPAAAEYLQQILQRIDEAVAITKDNRLAAKTVQTRHANRQRRAEPQYKAGDMVMLNSRNIRKQLKASGKSAKFYDRFLGPFKIIRAWPETSNYELQLPPEYSIHSSFHANLLRPYIANDPTHFPAREPPRPPSLIPEDNQYEVEQILEHRRRHRQTQYKVRWKGYSVEDDSWVAERDIDPALVDKYTLQLISEGESGN